MARRVLLQPGSTEIIEGELVLNEHLALNKSIATAGTQFHSIRQFAIDLIRDHRFNLDDRLTILGMFCNKVQAASEAGQGEKFPEIIGEYQN